MLDCRRILGIESEHLLYDRLYLGVVLRPRSHVGELGGGDDLAAAVVEGLDLLEVGKADDLPAGHDEYFIRLAVDLVLQPEGIPLHRAPLVDDIGVQVGEIPTGVQGKQLAYLHVVRVGRVVGVFVEVERRFQIVDGVEHGDVGHMPPVLQKGVGAGDIVAEFGQMRPDLGVAVRHFGRVGHMPRIVVIPKGVGDDQVDALGEDIHGTAVKVVHGVAREDPESLSHDLALIPVVGRGGYDLVGLLGEADVVDDVHARHGLVLEDLHQVALRTHGIDPFLKEDMPGQLDAVVGAPLVELADIIVREQLGAHVLELIPRLVGIRAYVHKQSGVIQRRTAPEPRLVILVEAGGPEPAAFRPVGRAAAGRPEGGLVEEGRGNGAVVEVFLEPLVIGLIGDVDKGLHRIFIQIIHAVPRCVHHA